MHQVDYNSTPLVQVRNLSKYFTVGHKAVLKAVEYVSFDIYKGETVSLVGESGCGKSTTGRCLIRIYEPDNGQVFYEGKDINTYNKQEARDFTRKVQMIFQNPYASLNPRMTVKEIVGEGLKLAKMPADQIEARVQELLETVGLNKEHMSRFSHEFSGGQRQRIGIARALSVDPKFIICDEPISALDVSIQAQILNMLNQLQEERGLTYLFIAHDLSVVKYISDRVIVMYLGMVVETAPTEELFAHPTHPYTQALLSAIPEADPKRARASHRIPIQGEIPSPVNPKPGCRFADRCAYATDICRQKEPETREIRPGHFMACHNR